MSPFEALQRKVASPSDAGAGKDRPASRAGGDLASEGIEKILQEVEALDEGAPFAVGLDLASLKGKNPLRFLFLTDVAAVLVGFAASWSFTAGVRGLFLGQNFPAFFGGDSAGLFGRFALLSAGVLLWLREKGHYRLRRPFWAQFQEILIAFSYAMFLDGFLHFAANEGASRLWSVSAWGFALIALLAFRGMLRAVLRRRGLWQVPTLLVGGGAVAREARAALRAEKDMGHEIVAQIENLPLLLERSGNSWRRLCRDLGAEHVLIALEGEELAAAEEALAQLAREGISYAVSAPLRHMPVLGMDPLYFFSHDVMIMAARDNLDRPCARFVKRTMDIVLSGAGLVVLCPLFAILALLVKRDGGPALFGHKRTGQGGRTFLCLKFRSMVMDSEARLRAFLEQNPEAREEWAREQKLKNDPRITRVGAFLRKTSLDELPQLINVFKGEMSLVGPRPIVQAEIDRYKADIVNYYKVKPGITGLWQVSGRNDVSYTRRVQMDTWYVRNWSLWNDVAILCKTVPALLNKKGAY